jgi:hypothetical protein
MLKCGFTILPNKFSELGNYVSSRVRELVVVIGVRFLIYMPLPLGSIPKDSLKIVVN